ncbi:MAG TPA: 23S rRNA (uracil(1939)-C(5))-methyltransferase RlmD [Bacteroidales bacterium]|nr:23S rRNA (uracil(1939)-C(5))-methyltransferase RlmD [Bacteroidales bacterium]
MAKRKFPKFENLEIHDISSDGKAVGRHENQVVFVSGLVPGDVADVQVIKKKKRFFHAVPVEIHHYSGLRTEPFCDHFSSCGGCKWQNLAYQDQLRFKEKQVVDQLTRLGEMEIPDVNPIIGSENTRYYRNKLEYSFSDKRWLEKSEIESDKEINDNGALGFHAPGRFDKVLQVDKCYLQAEPTNAIRNAVHDFSLNNQLSYYNPKTHEGLMRNLMIRITEKGEVMVVVIASDFNDDLENLLQHLETSFPEIDSLMYVVNKKWNDSIYDLEAHPYSGRNYITENIDGLDFKIGPKSFFQTNTKQTEVLYSKVKQAAGLTGSEIVYDLYSGTGSISLYLAREAKKVVGVEVVSEAVENANINAEINGISNVEFVTGDMKDVMKPGFVKSHGRPDVIVLDPPRAGVHKDVIEVIRKTAPDKIVYVSCNPATQARDISTLKDSYRIVEVQPVDMFPHTHHMENLILLEKIQ